MVVNNYMILLNLHVNTYWEDGAPEVALCSILLEKADYALCAGEFHMV